MSQFVASTFRPQESTCGLALAGSNAKRWISGDNLGTMYQSSPDGSSMLDLTSLEEGAIILAVAVSPSGEECAVGRDCEVDLCSTLPQMEVTGSMIVRSAQPITHVEYDNGGDHM
jgi:hypothetical protein